MSRFRRRLMGLAQLREAKRKDFVRVEYIENTSNAYIDTKLFTVYNDGRTYKHIVNLSYTVTNERQLNGANGTGYFGINKNGNFECACIQDSAIAAGNSWHNINFSYYNPTDTSLNIKYEIDNQLLERNISKATLFNYPYAIYIFAIGGKNGGAPSFFCKERIKSYQIYIDDVLVRDFIPMYQKSTDTYGLWDRVNEEFYTSPNGVKFTGGERVIADANENLYYLKNYVNVSNNQVKDLGFKPVGNDSWEVKFYFIGTGRQDILGARTSPGLRQYGFVANNNSQMIFLYNDTQKIYNKLSYGNKTFTLKAEKNKFYIYDANNKLIWNSSAIYTSGNNSIRNFFVGHFNGSVFASKARMYYFKYMRGDNLVWDLIPVQRCSDKVWGLFCKVHLGFYPSDGTEQFTGG